MKFSGSSTALLTLAATPLATHGFVPSVSVRTSAASSQCASSLAKGLSPSPLVTSSTANQRHASFMRMSSSSSGPDNELLKASAEQMKNMTPEDIDRMMKEMESMNPAQKAALKAMGMEPDLMMKSMKMMKSSPEMMKSAQKMMESMTPQQLMEQSKLAQEQMARMDAKDVEAATKAMESLSPDQLDAAAKVISEQGVPSQLKADEPLVVDTMYRTAELMSRPPTGGVTFQAFATLPPITVLSGTREEDLSTAELEECWMEGSNGEIRVDRTGFERVWNEVRDYFEGDIIDEARKTAGTRKMESSASSSASSTAAEVVGGEASGAAAAAPQQPVVGATLSAEEMAAVNAKVKQMSEDDVGKMLEQMQTLTPEQEKRMKEMGADPAMMTKAAKMMASNPLMKKAAAELMKNMSPEDMMRASQQAQQQMAGMSEADRKKALENIEKMNK